MRGIAIYDDEIQKILRDCCRVSTERASFVETIWNLPEDVRQQIDDNDPSLWWVSFKPIHDPTLLGPFETRQEALDAEKEYLKQQLAGR